MQFQKNKKIYKLWIVWNYHLFQLLWKKNCSFDHLLEIVVYMIKYEWIIFDILRKKKYIIKYFPKCSIPFMKMSFPLLEIVFQYLSVPKWTRSSNCALSCKIVNWYQNFGYQLDEICYQIVDMYYGHQGDYLHIKFQQIYHILLYWKEKLETSLTIKRK